MIYFIGLFHSKGGKKIRYQCNILVIVLLIDDEFAFYCEAFIAVKIYPELHKASHSFAEEKSRTTNDKQLFGINGHKRDGFI